MLGSAVRTSLTRTGELHLDSTLQIQFSIPLHLHFAPHSFSDRSNTFLTRRRSTSVPTLPHTSLRLSTPPDRQPTPLKDPAPFFLFCIHSHEQKHSAITWFETPAETHPKTVLLHLEIPFHIDRDQDYQLRKGRRKKITPN